MTKKLTEFSWEEVSEMDKILYEFNSKYNKDEAENEIRRIKAIGESVNITDVVRDLLYGITKEDLEKRMDGLSTSFDKYVDYLNSNWFIEKVKPELNVGENTLIPFTAYYLKSKGNVICEMGGLLPIYERQKAEIRNSKRGKWAIGISILAIILSASIPIIIELYKLYIDNQ